VHAHGRRGACGDVAALDKVRGHVEPRLQTGKQHREVGADGEPARDPAVTPAMSFFRANRQGLTRLCAARRGHMVFDTPAAVRSHAVAGSRLPCQTSPLGHPALLGYGRRSKGQRDERTD
jgi:hypothetical protein